MVSQELPTVILAIKAENVLITKEENID